MGKEEKLVELREEVAALRESHAYLNECLHELTLKDETIDKLRGEVEHREKLMGEVEQREQLRAIELVSQVKQAEEQKHQLQQQT